MSNLFSSIAKKIHQANEEAKEAERIRDIYLSNKDTYFSKLIGGFDLFYNKISQYVSEGDFFKREHKQNFHEYTFANTQIIIEVIDYIDNSPASASIKIQNKKDPEINFEEEVFLIFKENDFEWYNDKDQKIDFEYIKDYIGVNI